jgi:uncharacterized membrane protein YcaP (DUF421 family)
MYTANEFFVSVSASQTIAFVPRQGVHTMHEIFDLSMPWWHFVLRGIGVYLGLLLLMRLFGKHSFGEMSAFDMIVLVLVGGTLRNSIVGSDTSFIGALIGVVSILMADRVVAWICANHPRINRMVEGSPSLLVRHGELVPGALKRNSIPEAAIRRALHAAGMEDARDVLAARIEPNGRITLTRHAGQRHGG